jgi:hypothetical protein
VKKRSILSLVAGGLLAAMLPGAAVAQTIQAEGTSTLTVPAPDYVFDGRLASNLTREYVWDGRLAAHLTPDYVFDGRLASNLTREYVWDGRLASNHIS